MAISTCCGICCLKTGTIIIGILNLIFGVVALVIEILLIWAIYSPYYFIEAKSISGGLISYTLLVLISALLLIIGAVKRNINYVFPFVYLNFGNILLFFGGCITIFIEVCMQPGFPGVFIFLIFFGAGIALSLHIYFWLIIYFFYKELLITEQREQNTIRNNYRDNDQSLLTSA